MIFLFNINYNTGKIRSMVHITSFEDHELRHNDVIQAFEFEVLIKDSAYNIANYLDNYELDRPEDQLIPTGKDAIEFLFVHGIE